MQDHGGVEAARVIEGPVRELFHRFRVDWNRNGMFDHELSNLDEYVDFAAVDRNIEGTVPEDVLLVEGAAAAELSIELVGDYQGEPLTQVFSPFKASSPLFGTIKAGCDVVYDIGVEVNGDIVWYRQFTGEVSELTTKSGEHVSIRCLDRVEKLRRPIRLVKWAISEEELNRNHIDGQLVMSHWVIDQCLEFCDVSPRDIRPVLETDWQSIDPGNLNLYGTKYWANCNGSHLPTIGWVDNSVAVRYPPNSFQNYARGNNTHPSLDFDPDTRPFLLNGTDGDYSTVGPYFDQWELGYALGNDKNGGTIKRWVADRDEFTKLGAYYCGVSYSLDPSLGGSSYIENMTSDDVKLAQYWLWGAVTMESFWGFAYGSTPSIRLRAKMEGGHMWVYSDFDWGIIVGEPAFPRMIDTPIQVPDGASWFHFDTTWSLEHSDGHTWSKSWLETDLGTVESDWVDHGPFFAEPASLGPYNFDIFRNPDGIAGLVYSSREQPLMNCRMAVAGNWTKQDDLSLSRRTPKYAAVLDKGMNSISFCPESQDGRDAWDVISEVAAAEFGVVHWDENGVFRFWNYDTMAAKRENVVRDLTTDDVEGLGFTDSSAGVRNTLSAELGMVHAQWGDTVYEAEGQEEIYCPAESSVFYTFPSDDKVQMIEPAPIDIKVPYYIGDPETGGQIPMDYWEWWSMAGCCVIWDGDGPGGSEYDGDLESSWYVQWLNNRDLFNVTGHLDANGNTVIQVNNRWSWGIYLRIEKGPDRKAACKIVGTKLNDFGSLIYRQHNWQSVNALGQRNIHVSNDWLQEYSDRGTGLFNALLEMSGSPVPVTDDITIPGDPRIQLGDTIRVSDTDRMGTVKLQILGITREFSSEGLTDTYKVECAEPISICS